MEVRFEPGDLWSDVGDMAPAVLVVGTENALDRTSLGELAAVAELVRYPSMDPIPSEPTVVEESVPGRARILMNAGDLAPGWYALRLRKIPSGFQLLAPHFLKHFDDGTWGARFAIGSDPVLSAVNFCESELASVDTEIMITWSESVRSARPPAELVSVHQHGVRIDCKGEEATTRNFGYVWLRCPSIAPHEVTSVAIGPGLESKTGVPLEEFQLTLRLDQLTQTNDCRLYRP